MVKSQCLWVSRRNRVMAVTGKGASQWEGQSRSPKGTGAARPIDLRRGYGKFQRDEEQRDGYTGR
ncbi:TPA: hypothetical protein ACHSMM_004510 [Yersinia enterocolitica]